MAASSEQLGSLVLKMASSVPHAETLDALVLELASTFGESLDLWRAAVCSYDDTHVRVLSAWSATESVLTAGTEIALDLAPDTHTLVRHLEAHRLVVFDVCDLQLGLLDDLLGDEGVETSIVIPLLQDDVAFGFVWLASYATGVFDMIDPAIFRGLGAAIEHRAGQFLRAPARLTPDGGGPTP